MAGATLARGTIPFRLDRHARVFPSFSAGTLVALALLELVPEGAENLGGARTSPSLSCWPRFLPRCCRTTSTCSTPRHGMTTGCLPEAHEHPPLAMHGAVGLLLHLAVGGLALAAAVRESPTTLVAVSLALSAHKLADEITTVSPVLTHSHRRAATGRLLLGNAGSLLVRFSVGLAVALQRAQLGSLLPVLAGSFIYLEASDLIPAVMTPVCRKRDVVATACGMTAVAPISFLAY